MDQLEEYCDFLLNRGRKQNTVRILKLTIHKLLRALQEGGYSPRAEAINEHSILYLYRTLRTKESVKRNELRILSCFVVHFTGKDVVKQTDLLWNRDIVNRVFIRTDDLIILLEHADPTERMILVLGAFMGMRREEMANLKDSDIRGDMIRITGKGHGAGLIIEREMPPEVICELERYNAWKRAMDERLDDHILQVPTAKKRTLHRMGLNTIGTRVRELGRRYGIHVTTHSLRRFYATTLHYEVGADIVTVRDLMRHSDAATTIRCYIEAFDERQKEATRRFSAYMARAMS